MVVSKGNCKTCGKEFKKYKKIGESLAKFCSNACRVVKENHGISNCETCGIDFKWYRGPSQSIPRICSHKCRSGIVKKWMSKHEFTWDNLTPEQLNYQLRICFDERIEKTESCWIWKGSKTSRGYGSFHSDGKGKRIAAHRLSWKLHYGEIPNGLVIRHKCNNPICVNPAHLLLGTLKENSKDRIDSGNSCRGSKNKKSKLDEKTVKKIKEELHLGLKGLAKKYNISRSAICSIKQERTWKHIGIK